MFNPETYLRLGYSGLFVISYLAATILPASSEVVYAGLFTLNYNPWILAIVAGTGNYLGAATNYYAGYKGADFLFARYFTLKPETQSKGERMMNRWGPLILFFSWLPIIGDPLTIVAGMFHMNFWKFTMWVYSGKIIRYLVLWMILHGFF